jgi:LPXTG-motif cell wall-anchored protein
MKRVVVSLALVVSLLAGSTSSAFATSSGNPAGNNGVVKINNEIAPDNIPQNHPHVGCTFSVEFYNYDKNNTTANVAFALQAPTNRSGDSLKVTTGNLHPFIGGDAAGGGTDLDARESYTLAFTGTPQQNQGFHVKLTVEAPGSQGSDKKYKVFWVQPCAQSQTTSPQVLGAGTTNNTNSSANSAPTELPNTGAGNLLTLFGGTSLLAGFGHYVWRIRRVRV